MAPGFHLPNLFKDAEDWGADVADRSIKMPEIKSKLLNKVLDYAERVERAGEKWKHRAALVGGLILSLLERSYTKNLSTNLIENDDLIHQYD